MEHSLHLAAKHFVQTVAPRFKKRGASAPDSGGEDDNDHDDHNGDDNDGDDNDDNNNNDDDINAGDSLGKAITLVKQVCSYIALSISRTKSCHTDS
jgi:hypothetical protein